MTGEGMIEKSSPIFGEKPRIIKSAPAPHPIYRLVALDVSLCATLLTEVSDGKDKIKSFIQRGFDTTPTHKLRIRSQENLLDTGWQIIF